MQRVSALGAALVAIWFLWSGHSEPLLVGLGLGSCAFVLALVWRMGTIDEESVPLELAPGMITFLPWLGWEVVKANIDVARRVLSPAPSIAPQVFEVPAGDGSELRHVLYANSITLTPGTVSMRVEDGRILVHALSAEAAADLATGAMERRVGRLFGAR